MAKVNAKAKGSSGERELCEWLKSQFNLLEAPKRDLSQTRDGGADVICEPFAFEVKRCENVAEYEWWNQIQNAVNNKNCSAFGLQPVVAYRRNRKDWEFLISAEHIGIPRGWIKLTKPVFIKWVRKFVRDNTHGINFEKKEKFLELVDNQEAI